MVLCVIGSKKNVTVPGVQIKKKKVSLSCLQDLFIRENHIAAENYYFFLFLPHLINIFNVTFVVANREL